MDHYLSIQRSKNVFWRDDHGLVLSNDKLAFPAPLGLEPLMVMGVFLDHLPAQAICYFRESNPHSIRTMLSWFWSKDQGIDSLPDGIKGKPESLVIDKRLKNVISDHLFEWLDSEGVEWTWSSGHDKRFTAKARQLQDLPYMGFSSYCPRPPSINNPNAINTLNSSASRMSSLDTMSTEKMDYLKASSKIREYTHFQDDYVAEYDPFSDSLYVRGMNDVKTENLEITMEGNGYVRIAARSDLTEKQAIFQEDMRQLLHSCIITHPAFPKLMAAHIECTQTYLKEFLAGRKELSHTQAAKLFNFMNFKIDEYCGMVPASTAHVFVIQKATKYQTGQLFVEISNGGDFMYCREVTPEGAWADPDFRLVCAKSHSGIQSLVAIPRDSKASLSLDTEGEIINFEGTTFIPVSLYDKLLDVAKKAVAHPERHQEHCKQLYKVRLTIEKNMERVRYPSERLSYATTWRRQP